MAYKVKVSPGISMTRADNNIVLFSKKSGLFFGLNEVGFEMLKGLQTTDSHALSQELAARFQVDARQIEQDMTELVEQMESKKLVERIF